MLVKCPREFSHNSESYYEDSKKYDLNDTNTCLDAWKSYKLATYNKIYFADGCMVEEEDRPPPDEHLVLYMLNLWINSLQIQREISVNLLRWSCQLYKSILKYCLTQLKMIEVFRPYEEEFVDICLMNTKYSAKYILSGLPSDFINDEHRVELFSCSMTIIYQDLVSNPSLVINLANYLLLYSCPIKSQHYQMISNFLKMLEQHLENRKLVVLVNLILAKLCAQGIYGHQLNAPPITKTVIPSRAGYSIEWIEEIIRQIYNENDEKFIETGLHLLSLVQPNDLNYSHARVAMAQIYADQDEYNIAGQCCLQADNIPMAASYFLLIDDNKIYYSRQHKDSGHLLNISECSTMTLDKLLPILHKLNIETTYNGITNL